jgi:hypothetical protein
MRQVISFIFSEFRNALSESGQKCIILEAEEKVDFIAYTNIPMIHYWIRYFLDSDNNLEENADIYRLQMFLKVMIKQGEIEPVIEKIVETVKKIWNNKVEINIDPVVEGNLEMLTTALKLEWRIAFTAEKWRIL